VRDAFKDRTTYSRHNGRDNITLSIQKRAGANVVQVSDSIKAVLAAAQKQAPGAVRFDVTFDMSKYIRNQVADLENNIWPHSRGHNLGIVSGLATEHDRVVDFPFSMLGFLPSAGPRLR
jgi:hypothetical protein